MMDDCEVTECPLCMEIFDLDDLGFYPCPCGYQICRFCWHRLYNLEDNIESSNKGTRGLCPACRQEYPESPVCFNSGLTIETIEQMKKQKKKRNKLTTQKQKQLEDKQKLKEILKTQEKSLTGLRVVQKNLLFVIGLPTRLTQDDLRREFSKYGKIHKLVVGNCNSNVNTAYVTYTRAEDAVKAILALNNQSSQVNRLKESNKNGKNSVLTLKASLGTTKYCTHFLRSQQCPKLPDCMYLHELAESEASFTKEEMQKGKHTEYEKKLINQYVLKEEEMKERDKCQNGEQDTQQQLSSEHYQEHESEPVTVTTVTVETELEAVSADGNAAGNHNWATLAVNSQEIIRDSSAPASNGDNDINTKISMNTIDDTISSSSDSLSTSYSTCSSGSPGILIYSPRDIVDDEQCVTNVTKNRLQKNDDDDEDDLIAATSSSNNKRSTQSDLNKFEDDGLDFDPISVSTNGLQDLIKSSSSSDYFNNGDLISNRHDNENNLKHAMSTQHHHHQHQHQNSANEELQEWRTSLKAIFPNVNITFANNSDNSLAPRELPFVKQMSNQCQQIAPSFTPFYMMQPQVMCPDFTWLSQQQQQQQHQQQQQQQQKQPPHHIQNLQRHSFQMLGGQNPVQRLYSPAPSNQIPIIHEPNTTHMNQVLAQRRFVSKPVYACQPPPGFTNF